MFLTFQFVFFLFPNESVHNVEKCYDFFQ